MSGFSNSSLSNSAQKYINYKPENTNIYEGLANSGTITTLTDNTAIWEVDSLVDKVVCIVKDSICYYAVILSNTPTQLTFDDNLEIIPNSLTSFRILNTLVIDDSNMDLLVALDILDNECAVLLPLAVTAIERRYIHTYIETAINGFYRVPIICRGTDRQAGNKYGTLEHKGEGVKLQAHTWYSGHYDIIQTYNIKRYASGYFDTNESVTSTSWQIVGNIGNLIYDNYKRFVEKEISGKNQLTYTSLLMRDFSVKFNANVIKTGAGGELEISIAVYDKETDTIIYLDDRVSTTLFGGGEGVRVISVTVPVELIKSDRVLLVSRITTGTFSIGAGSTVEIVEY